MKKLFSVFALLSALSASAVEVSGILVRQNWPWSKTIHVDYTVAGCTGSCQAKVSAWNDTQKICDVPYSALSGATGVPADGTYRLFIDPEKVPGFQGKGELQNFRVGIELESPAADSILYAVVDLTSASNVVYVTAQALTNNMWGAWIKSMPSWITTTNPFTPTFIWTGVTNSDTYKTDKLVLRRIPAGTFTMGCSAQECTNCYAGGSYSTVLQHKVRFPKDFYIGVFELTQTQWYRICSDWPSTYTNLALRATRPVESVSFDTIRGTAINGGQYDWPTDKSVAPSSFMGLLRSKTGLTFDLPTESQWEYACRAGTSGLYYMNDSIDYQGVTTIAHLYVSSNPAANRWTFNRAAVPGDGYNSTFPVGTLLPNAWGLYDMIGNADERCLDWYADNYGVTDMTQVTVDPDGPTYGNATPVNSDLRRDMRGSSCFGEWYYCRCGSRGNVLPSTKSADYGLRVCLPAE